MNESRKMGLAYLNLLHDDDRVPLPPPGLCRGRQTIEGTDPGRFNRLFEDVLEMSRGEPAEKWPASSRPACCPARWLPWTNRSR